jgi:hypothetical protein
VVLCSLCGRTPDTVEYSGVLFELRDAHLNLLLKRRVLPLQVNVPSIDLYLLTTESGCGYLTLFALAVLEPRLVPRHVGYVAVSEHHTLDERCGEQSVVVQVRHFFAFLSGILLCVKVLVDDLLLPLDVAKHEF